MSTPIPTPELPKPGSTVYDLYGNVAQVNTHLPNGAILVGIMFESIDYDSRGDERTVEFEGPLQIWHKWFTSPPKAKKAEEVATLEKQVDELRDKLHTLRAEESQARRGTDDRMRFLKQHAALQRLDDYLSGKITHIVSVNWNRFEIFSTEGWEKFRRNSNRPEGVKLLSLFGNAEGDLTWKLNEYYDSSGSTTTAYPCCGKQEAIEKLTELTHEEFKSFLQGSNNFTMAEGAVTTCKKHAIPIPAGVEEKIAVIKAKNLQGQIEHKKRELQALEAQITTPATTTEG